MDNLTKVFGIVLLIVVLGVGYVVLQTVSGLNDLKNEISRIDLSPKFVELGGVADSINFSGVTSATTTCKSFNSSGTDAIILGTTTNRTSFVLQNTASSAVRLCRGTSCGGVAHEGIGGKGIILAPTSTLVKSLYEQSDGYIGPYACVGVGVVSTTDVYFEEGRL